MSTYQPLKTSTTSTIPDAVISGIIDHIKSLNINSIDDIGPIHIPNLYAYTKQGVFFWVLADYQGYQSHLKPIYEQQGAPVQRILNLQRVLYNLVSNRLLHAQTPLPDDQELATTLKSNLSKFDTTRPHIQKVYIVKSVFGDDDGAAYDNYQEAQDAINHDNTLQLAGTQSLKYDPEDDSWSVL